MSQDIFGLKGYWNPFNDFVIEETGEMIKVYPYNSIGNKYFSLLPIHCYIQVIYNGDHNIISDVMIIDD